MKRRVYDTEPHAHFLTFSCYRRRNLLETEHAKRIVVGQLGARLAPRDGHCLGFVVMPNHVHALIWFPEPGGLSEFMDVWKTQASRAIAAFYEQRLPNFWTTFTDRTIWQPRFHDVNVLTAKKAEEKLDYMHANPVKAGLCDRPSDYRFSSARWYESGKPVGLPIRWPPNFD